MEGQIRKAISGFYYVQNNDKLVQCKGRGVFRKRGIHPLVGDFVTYKPDGDNDATITEVHERKNELVRPPIANVDQALLVFSIVEPDFSTHLLDRFLTVIESFRIEPIICLTKKDLASESELNSVLEAAKYYEEIGYQVVISFIDDPQLPEDLKPILKGKVTVLAGQSGVGKSTLLNTVLPSLGLKTGAISDALGRGKHTTRHVELLEVGEGLVADTPGFSSLEFEHIEKEQLSSNFIEFNEPSRSCKFRGCLHENEPSCAVKEMVESGQIAPFRYHNYLHFLKEIKERKPRYY
ncbi:ribosome small subunit-dependent GTPase A [Sporosarcina ureilytica]|uniref:Small ribosomal subunit biogenesis GTPase RsgA n=1 Tax=Sporosarcina ureilytica TaxID=298596 RepID=A0A1D8JHW7_9BACL|nr:ribosome small subunit-dependent GTPase A [Sporosarcina ureilytica]